MLFLLVNTGASGRQLFFLSVPLYEMVVMRLGSEAKQVAFSYIGTIIYNHSVTGLT